MEELFEPNPLIVTCVWCGKEFELKKTGKTRRYCSDICRVHARNHRDKEYRKLQQEIFEKEKQEFQEGQRCSKSLIFDDEPLTDILKKAGELNMTYGEYVSYKYASTKKY